MAMRSTISAPTLTDLLFANAEVGLCLVAPDASILRANGEWLRSTGLTEEEAVGENIIDLFPATRDMALAMHARARTGHRVEVPRHAQVVNGRETWWEGSIEPVPMEGGTGLLIIAREVAAAQALAAPSGGGTAAPIRDARGVIQGALSMFSDVTERKRAEETLAAETEKYRSLFQHSLDAVYLTRADGTILDANAAACALHGMTVDEIRQAGRAGLVVNDERHAAALKTRAATGFVRAEMTVRRKDGTTVPVEVHSVLLDPARPEECAAFVISRDISARKRSDEALRDREASLRRRVQDFEALMNTAPVAIWVSEDPQCHRISGNRAANTLFEVQEGHNMSASPAPGDAAIPHRFFRDGREVPACELPMQVAVAQNADVRNAEFDLVTPSGARRTLWGNATPLRDDRGNVRGCVSAFLDITERKITEAALRDSEEKLRLAKDAAGMGAWDWNLVTGELIWTPRCRALFGIAPDEAVTYETFQRTIHPDDVGPIDRAIRDALATGNDYDAVMRVPLPDGSVRWVEAKGRAFYDEQRRPVRMAGMALDITERKRAEEALRDSEERYRTMGETLPYGVWLCNAQGGAEYVSQSFLDLLEMTPEQMREFGWTHRLPPEDVQPMLDKWLHCVRTGTPWDSEHRVLGPDGKYHHVLTRGLPVRDATGKITCWVGINLDIDERKAMEEELREADRRKDEFLAMLSHELRNPLAPIRNSTYILRHAEPGSEQARRAQAVIERQAGHLTRLVDDLLDVTRIARGKIDLRRENIDVREVVRRTAEDFRPLLEDRGVAFRAVLPQGKVWVDADATRITQIVGNLLHNAAKFTRRGDEVALTLAADATGAEIRVRDTGAGIDATLLPTMFEPFVQGERTLARTEGGLGLGLALVKGIAELHGGTVRADSAGTGKGAQFIVRLPLAATARTQRRVGQPVPEASNGARRVLVVDDNADAAESLADIVEMLGHKAEIAYDGTSAVEKARASRPDIVLCDIGLPGMSGYEVAKALRDAGTTAQLFAVSGYAQPDDVKNAVQAGFDGHLAKPTSIEDIERLLAL